MARKTCALLVACISFVFALGWHFLWSAQTPSSQPPLTYLTAKDPGQFASAFDRAADHARMVLLFSPT